MPTVVIEICQNVLLNLTPSSNSAICCAPLGNTCPWCTTLWQAQALKINYTKFLFLFCHHVMEYERKQSVGKRWGNHFSGEDIFFPFRRFKPISYRYFLLLFVKDRRKRFFALRYSGLSIFRSKTQMQASVREKNGKRSCQEKYFICPRPCG